MGQFKYILELFYIYIYILVNWYKDLKCINDFWCWILSKWEVSEYKAIL